jgi:tetratricopeptide (TPR) repeat protein
MDIKAHRLDPTRACTVLASSLCVTALSSSGAISPAFAQTVMPRSDTQMTVPHTVDSEKNAQYACSKYSNDPDKARAATALSTQTSDKNALACAADLRFELAISKPDDLSANIDALQSLLSYVDHVRALKVYELSQIDWPEYDVRLEHGSTLASKLLPNARQKWPNDPRTMILCAAVERSLAGPSDPGITLAAIDKIKRALAIDPKALNGLGQLIVGRSYLELAPIFGGGAANAIPYLVQARDLSPGDPRAYRYLAEAEDELGRSNEALAALGGLAKVAPRDSDLQLYADEWRMGEGMATRLKAPELANTFAAKRADLMRGHPGLLSRKVESVWGHGETDPISGKSDYQNSKTTSH